ncbi:MAG: hypothetical protein LDL26_06240 [Caenispirillum bisanense]|uniref:Uncharacterized protein n=1 Tax=Caenispirillum bisanense TaxID=414052 RepID=A0A286G1T4_9PROT|nr:hypothetical protein [Caenispirillum bisanense]MCA1940581.1 hypothetical protein [Caenispirillum bisanense]SOD89453.1 hypothetical protein SAMN05421508_101224 [Caenispirillum bisanense]
MLSFLGFLVALPTLYAMTSWAMTGYRAVAWKPVDRQALMLAVSGAILVAVSAPFTGG